MSGGSGSSQAVMLSYIVSKNNGIMSVSSTHGEVSSISVQIGGTTQQFIVGRKLSLHHGLEVRRYDNTMGRQDHDRWGRLIFSR